jgi:hypothetical protein
VSLKKTNFASMPLFSSEPQLVDQGFRALSIVVKEFLAVLPFDCVEMLIETDALYGQQQLHLNVSLASIGQLASFSVNIHGRVFNTLPVGHFGLCSPRDKRPTAATSWQGRGGTRVVGHLPCVGPTLRRRSAAGAEKCV